MAHGHATIWPAPSCSGQPADAAAPAMNPLMWNNAATRRNVAQLERDGVALIAPMPAKWPKPERPASAGWRSLWKSHLLPSVSLRPSRPRPLAGKRVLITAGRPHEPIDPVR